jgi:hypothetical protein
MKTKYYRYTLKGEHSAEDAQRKIGDAAAQGLLLRIDNFGGETQVYIASQGASQSAKSSATKASTSDIKVEEVLEKDVTNLSRK